MLANAHNIYTHSYMFLTYMFVIYIFCSRPVFSCISLFAARALLFLALTASHSLPFLHLLHLLFCLYYFGCIHLFAVFSKFFNLSFLFFILYSFFLFGSLFFHFPIQLICDHCTIQCRSPLFNFSVHLGILQF